MREIPEALRNAILAAIPTDNLVLLYAPLYGSNPTIPCRVSSANNGTFTNGKFKTLKNGLVVPSYDGTVYITNSTANWRSSDSQGAIIVIFRCLVSAGSQALFDSADQASSTAYMEFFVNSTGKLNIQWKSGATNLYVRGGTTVNDGEWYSATLLSDGAAWNILVDGVVETLSVILGSNNGNWFADLAGRDNFTVGAWKGNSVGDYIIGNIGLVVVYSVAPSTAAILRMSNRLKPVFK